MLLPINTCYHEFHSANESSKFAHHQNRKSEIPLPKYFVPELHSAALPQILEKAQKEQDIKGNTKAARQSMRSQCRLQGLQKGSKDSHVVHKYVSPDSSIEFMLSIFPGSKLPAS